MSVSDDVEVVRRLVAIRKGGLCQQLWPGDLIPEDTVSVAISLYDHNGMCIEDLMEAHLAADDDYRGNLSLPIYGPLGKGCPECGEAVNVLASVELGGKGSYTVFQCSSEECELLFLAPVLAPASTSVEQKLPPALLRGMEKANAQEGLERKIQEEANQALEKLSGRLLEYGFVVRRQAMEGRAEEELQATLEFMEQKLQLCARLTDDGCCIFRARGISCTFLGCSIKLDDRDNIARCLDEVLEQFGYQVRRGVWEGQRKEE